MSLKVFAPLPHTLAFFMDFLKSTKLWLITLPNFGQILSPLTVNDYTTKDSFSFAKEVFNFDHSLFMARLDVESLFTNIPIDETIKNAVDDLFSNNMYQGKPSKSDLYYLLKLATSKTYFIFDNILYK